MTRSLATLTDLVVAVRKAIDVRTGWSDTADLVADQLRVHLPGPQVLTPDQRLGRPDRVAGHLLHAEPDGAFSIPGLIWRPGQTRPPSPASAPAPVATTTEELEPWTSTPSTRY